MAVAVLNTIIELIIFVPALGSVSKQYNFFFKALVHLTLSHGMLESTNLKSVPTRITFRGS
jgi:fucose permease